MKEITATELKQRIESGEQLAILDIREADMFADWRIPGAFNLPVIRAMRINDFQPLVDRAGEIPRDEPVVVVCNQGVSSTRAVSALEPLGFDVINLIGGMKAWSGVSSEANIGLASKPDATFIQVRRNGKGCLSYFIASEGRALVVDPAVDQEVYLGIAAREGARIERVLETHVHADHISRARTLCAATGATLVMPPNQRVNYDFTPIADGETIEVGGVRLTAIHTPGHTGESTCYLVEDEALLSGDTLFVNSVGRPDLEKGDAGAVDGAHMLFKSLHDRLVPLADGLCVFPAHTAAGIGFDGKPICARLGELRTGIGLLGLDEDAFVKAIVDGLTAKPPSHEFVISINEGKSELGAGDPLDIEAGPNRCAVGR